jgi:N-acetylmuramic acid 6-phosphate etherase
VVAGRFYLAGGTIGDRVDSPARSTAQRDMFTPFSRPARGPRLQEVEMVPDRSHILTEKQNPASALLDAMEVEDAVALMNAEDARAIAAVAEQKAAIARAVVLVAEAFAAGGRLVYFGAGTSGRLGVLDASECPPTFCSDPAMVVGVIAGGEAALKRSIENVEDDAEAGARAVREAALGPKDVAFGIAAGGTTRFVHAALIEAKARGSKTVFLICTDPGHVALSPPPDLFIAVKTGPEVLTGSTRLKAGTATKLVLNIVTTLAMVHIGKTYGNLMVDIDAMKNAKLVDRSLRIIAQVTGVDRLAAGELLTRGGGNVKRAIVMHAAQCTPAEADAKLAAAGGRLRQALGAKSPA